MGSDEWNEGLCPDPVVMNKLASIGRESGSTFMEMKSQDTLPNVLNELKVSPKLALFFLKEI